MSIDIVGCGMAGLLAGKLLAHRSPVIHEIKSELPNNHSAVLRFRSNVVGEALNIPFKPVTMIKTVAHWRNPVADALAYSFKNTGVYRSDRSIVAGTEVGERFIAPSDLIQRLAVRQEIKFGKPYDGWNGVAGGAVAISTLPMPILMAMLRYPHCPKFEARPGINIRAKIKHCDAYVSVLVPDPEIPFSRVSITKDELIIEIPNINDPGRFTDVVTENNIHYASKLLGLLLPEMKVMADMPVSDIKVLKQQYHKILPIDDDERKEFIHWASDKYGVYSLGRYATWRPKLLLDDLVKDIRLIDRWIGKRYEMARHR